MTQLKQYIAEEIAIDHSDGLFGRREALRRLGLLGLAAASAPEQFVADMRAGVAELRRRVPGRKIGAIGFCFGGSKQAAVLAVYAGLDKRVNASMPQAETALEAAGMRYRIQTVPGRVWSEENGKGHRDVVDPTMFLTSVTGDALSEQLYSQPHERCGGTASDRSARADATRVRRAG